MRQLIRSLSYSRVVSTIALFVALGGSAYAIGLGKGDVNSRIVKNGSIKSADVKNNALKGRDILESTLDTAQFTVARSSGNSSCDPELIYVTCGSVALQTPAPGRILAIAGGELIPAATQASGHCQLVVTDAPRALLANQSERPRGDFGFTLAGVSDVVPASSYTVELRCIEGAGELSVQVDTVTAALVGAG